MTDPPTLARVQPTLAPPPAPVSSALTAAAATLREASTTPRLDAELLLADVLGVDRARLVIDHDRVLAAHAHARLNALVVRRAAGEPIAYVLGRRWFRNLELHVDPRVLIPRPETELLVEVGLTLAPGASVLDVGTGSGAVALALKQERPDLRVAGIDASADAITVARANAARLSVDVAFSVGNLLDGSAPADAVLANLPYVPDGAPLPVDVAGFEPAAALRAGPDGLDLIRGLVAAVATRAWPAVLALEISADQAAAVRTLVADGGYDEVAVARDLAGRERVVIGRR